MSRRFRFYEKKRGHRRTVPQRLGSMGEALFFGFFLLVGAAALWAMLGLLIVPEWRANRQFIETTGVVRARHVREADDGDGVRYWPEIDVEYQVDGRTYHHLTYDIAHIPSATREQVQAKLDLFELGQPYPCWYDPMDPDRVVLVRGYSGWLYLVLLVPVSFIAISTRRLVLLWLNWDTSTERRAAMAQRAAEFDLFEGRHQNLLPTVPSDTNWTNSPGTRLAYRLPIDAAPQWMLSALLAACLLWNGVASVFVVMAVRTHLRHEPDWLMTLLSLPFVVIGTVLFYFLYRQFRLMTRIGSTRVEISHHPLYPGGEYDLFVSQAGHLTMKSLEVVLRCEEQATYRQGTDTRTETRCVLESPVLAEHDFEILPAKPFESQCRVRIPECAMHSFKSDHNQIGWKLLVRADDARGRDYQRAFPVIVHPRSGRAARHDRLLAAPAARHDRARRPAPPVRAGRHVGRQLHAGKRRGARRQGGRAVGAVVHRRQRGRGSGGAFFRSARSDRVAGRPGPAAGIHDPAAAEPAQLRRRHSQAAVVHPRAGVPGPRQRLVRRAAIRAGARARRPRGRYLKMSGAADPFRNPFSASRVRPGALAYQFSPGESAAGILVRLAECGGRGAIVGPHGSGKSTLLAALVEQLESDGRPYLLVTLHDGERHLPLGRFDWEKLPPAGLLIVDGYEQLGFWARRKLNRLCNSRGWGLLVTAHQSVGLPLVAQAAATPELAQAIVERLLAAGEFHAPTPITPQDVQDRFAARAGNLREVLFDLYDLYESRRTGSLPPPVSRR